VEEEDWILEGRKGPRPARELYYGERLQKLSPAKGGKHNHPNPKLEIKKVFISGKKIQW